jgi:hypothetical protein
MGATARCRCYQDSAGQWIECALHRRERYRLDPEPEPEKEDERG